ncbi:unnamed protein product [Orchesella dallaii]|uniref:Uncharacterized protein n=1 Tax=Orchesella dallaii TaxID=48710 RepID=A0ABP1Q1A3_9HEXA
MLSREVLFPRMESKTRVVWELKHILSECDLETLALSKDACCILKVGEKGQSRPIQLRFFFDKFEKINEFQDFQSRSRYLSLNVDLLRDGEQSGNEEIRFIVKVDLLTNYLQFRLNLLSEVIIKSEEDRRGKLVKQKFLKYLYSPIPANGFLGQVKKGLFLLRPSLILGITVTLIDSKAPIRKNVKKGGRLMNIGNFCQRHHNHLFDKKLVAKSCVYLNAKSFIKAVWGPKMIRNAAEVKSSTGIRVPPPFDFDPKRFLRAIWQWLYTGELEESTGKWIQTLMTRINTLNQMTNLLNHVEWTANNICRHKSDTLELQRYIFGVEMRNEMVKVRTLQRFSEFLGEFWSIISPFLADQ